MTLNKIDQNITVDIYVKVMQQKSENIFNIARNNLIDVVWRSNTSILWDTIIEELSE